MWHATTILFKSEVNGVVSLRPLCEERIVLFDTSDETQAVAAAHDYGIQESHSYENVRGELVTWVFAGVEKVEVLSTSRPQGWEVSAKFVRKSVRTLRKITHGA